MLSPDKIHFKNLFIYLISSCSDNMKDIQHEKSLFVVGKQKYYMIYNAASDSIKIWNVNNVGNYSVRYNQNYILDSLLCFNTDSSRFISAIHRYRNIPSPSDELLIFCGEKINSFWYFFGGGASVTLPRTFYQDNNKTPLSYQQLHQIALKEVYSGYLKSNGEINEAWFTSQFEGPGWVNWNDSQEKINSHTRKDYEQFHLKVIRNNWNGVNKDSIKKLPTKNNNLP